MLTILVFIEKLSRNKKSLIYSLCLASRVNATSYFLCSSMYIYKTKKKLSVKNSSAEGTCLYTRKVKFPEKRCDMRPSRLLNPTLRTMRVNEGRIICSQLYEDEDER